MSETGTNLPAVQEHRPPAIRAGGKPMAIVASSMEDAYRMGIAVTKAGLAPPGMNSEACMIAIMIGAEVGLTPMTSVQKIAIINNRPTIWGDVALGLCHASGLVEEIDETFVGEGEALKAVCDVRRKGKRKPVVRDFSVADAKKARLWSKPGPWQDYPKRMLQMRARAFALRDTFPDVLGGMYLREEIEDDMRDVTPEKAAEPPNPNGEDDNASDRNGGAAGGAGAGGVGGADAGPTVGALGAAVKAAISEKEGDFTAAADSRGGGGAAAGEAASLRHEPGETGEEGGLPPLDNPENTAAGWISDFLQAPTAEDLKEFAEQECIFEYLDQHAFSPRTAASIEGAYARAMAQFPGDGELPAHSGPPAPE